MQSWFHNSQYQGIKGEKTHGYIEGCWKGSDSLKNQKIREDGPYVPTIVHHALDHDASLSVCQPWKMQPERLPVKNMRPLSEPFNTQGPMHGRDPGNPSQPLKSTEVLWSFLLVDFSRRKPNPGSYWITSEGINLWIKPLYLNNWLITIYISSHLSKLFMIVRPSPKQDWEKHSEAFWHRTRTHLQGRIVTLRDNPAPLPRRMGRWVLSAGVLHRPPSHSRLKLASSSNLRLSWILILLLIHRIDSIAAACHLSLRCAVPLVHADR